MWCGAENITGLKISTETTNCENIYILAVVGERSICAEALRVSGGGAYRSENAGMSNANQSRLLITEYPRFPQHCTSTAG